MDQLNAPGMEGATTGAVAALGDAQLALFLDVDGTLLDLAARPEDVVTPPGLVATLAGAERKLAGALALVSGRPYKPGDQVSYYITGTKKTVPAYEFARLVSDWDATNRDENIEYYVAKLQELAKKFAPFVEAPAPAQSSFSF